MKETKSPHQHEAVSYCKISASETLKLFREIAENVLVVEVIPKAYSCS